MVGNTRQVVATPPTELMVELGSRKKRPAPQPPTILPQVVTTPGVGVGVTTVHLGGHQSAPRLSPQSVPQPAPRVTVQTGSQVDVQIGSHGGEQAVPHAAPRIEHQGSPTSQAGLGAVPQAAPRAVPHVGLPGDSHTGAPQALPRSSHHQNDLHTEDQTRSQPGTLVSHQLSWSATTSHPPASKPVPSRPAPPRLQMEAGPASDAYDKRIRLDSDPEPKARHQINTGATPNQSGGGTTPVMDGTTIPGSDNIVLTYLGRSKRKAPAAPQPTSRSVPTSSRSPGTVGYLS